MTKLKQRRQYMLATPYMATDHVDAQDIEKLIFSALRERQAGVFIPSSCLTSCLTFIMSNLMSNLHHV
jgi:hypothetical protein